MTVRRLFLTSLVACALAAGLLISGCGGDDSSGSGASTTTAPEPLAIEERVVEGDLGGLTLKDAQVASTPEEFSKLVDDDDQVKESARLRTAGYVAGAVRTNAAPAGQEEMEFGISGAIQFASPEQAQAELTHLADEFASDLPPGAKQASLADVPGSRSITATGVEQGQSFAFGSAVFADGPFVYAVIAGGAKDKVQPDAVLEAASALYARVKGRPAP